MAEQKQYAYTDARLDVLKSLKAAIGKTYTPTFDELETPPQPEMGDVAFPCFTLAKGLKRSPAEIATELAAKIEPAGPIGRVAAKGPYVNFYFDMEVFAPAVIKEVLVAGDAYGRLTSGNGRRVMVEYVNLNTHKEVHIGHFRNMVVGSSVVALLSAVGYDVIPVSYINDLGNNVAKCVWGMKALHDGEVPEKGDEANFLGRVYAEVNAKAEEDEEVRKEISEVQRQLEQQKGEWYKLWKTTRKWSIDAMYKIFTELRLPIDVQYYESDVIDEAADMVRELQDRGIAVESEGAIIVDLEDQNLGVNLLVKSDGTMLYNAKDLGLAKRKASDYKLDRSFIVVDHRQSLAMQQLFATLKLYGMEIPYEHLSYNFLTLADGAMSSRKGNVVLFEELRDRVRLAAAEETRERHNDWSESQVQKTATRIAEAAMIYTVARVDMHKDIVFDLDAALSFEGATGPYLLYTLSRIESLLKKSDVRPKWEVSVVDSPESVTLVRLVAKFPHVLTQAANEINISAVPQYAYELAQAFSSYYGATRIIDDEAPEQTASRLALAHAVLITLRNALGLMNIVPVKEM